MKDKIYTIFGEEHFIPPQMITLNQRIENHIIDETYKASLNLGVQIDKERLEKWLKLCHQLEQIEQSDLIDFATKKRFNDLVIKNEQLRKENEELKKQSKQLAVEKLEELLEYLSQNLSLYTYRNEQTPDHSLFKHIELFTKETQNKINEMINELKGEKDE